MTPQDPADVDRRFQELMRAEFADDPAWPSDDAPADPVEPAPAEAIGDPEPRVRPFTAGRVDDDTDDIDLAAFDDLSYREIDETPHIWSSLSLLGFVLLGGGLLGMLAMVFGLRLDAPWPQLMLFSTLSGLGVLLVQALRSPPSDDDDDNGARI